MNSKPPPGDEEKTRQVGSGRNWRPADLVPESADPGKNPGKIPAVEPEAAADDGKTAFVGDSADDANAGDDDGAAGRLRPAPAPRLPWPARDLNNLERGAQRARSAADQTRPQPMLQDDDRTRLYNPALAGRSPEEARPVSGAAAQSAAAVGSSREALDPVVGWLVVVDGHGKGRSLEIGVGANSIGRDKGQKLKVDFGDQHISRDKHAILIFDPRSNRFFLQSGDVRNLTYIGDDLVLSPTELKGGETILIGETKLRFVALCGPQFGWS
jgi:hypothetical protein